MSLDRAMTMLFPSTKWTVHLSPELSKYQKVSWKVTPDKSAIEALAEQNNLIIATNKQSGNVGVAKSTEVASALADGGGNAWFVEAPSTMKDVVESWVTKAGYNGVSWGPSQNYEIKYPAVIVGDLTQAISKLLASVANDSLPLQAIEASNKVIMIQQGGWEAP